MIDPATDHADDLAAPNEEGIRRGIGNEVTRKLHIAADGLQCGCLADDMGGPALIAVCKPSPGGTSTQAKTARGRRVPLETANRIPCASTIALAILNARRAASVTPYGRDMHAWSIEQCTLERKGSRRD